MSWSGKNDIETVQVDKNEKTIIRRDMVPSTS